MILEIKRTKNTVYTDHQADVSGTWELCTTRIRFDHDAGSMIKYHKNLTSRGYRALIYRLASTMMIYESLETLLDVLVHVNPRWLPIQPEV